MDAYQAAAFKVGQLAEYMVWGYKAHIAAIRIVPRLDYKTVSQFVADHPSDSVQRKDGTTISFRTFEALVSGGVEAIEVELNRVWLIGALLAVGDALKDNNYFDHAPELELVRHLRNGIAHGNRFDIRFPEELVEKHPAHNAIFKITPELNGKRVLFDFMEAGDVLDLLSSVGSYLKQLPSKQPTP